MTNYEELAEKIKEISIQTKRLLIRPFCDHDEDGLFELFHDENTMRMDADFPIIDKNDEFMRRIDVVKNGPLVWFFSEEIESTDFVGYVMLQDENEAVALGFAITAEKQGMGYGTEMLNAIIHLLQENGVEEIRIKTWEKNIPCQKLAEKLGFNKVGIVANDHKDSLTGEIGNSFLYSLK